MTTAVIGNCDHSGVAKIKLVISFVDYFAKESSTNESGDDA